jgi:hypothetical protein
VHNTNWIIFQLEVIEDGDIKQLVSNRLTTLQCAEKKISSKSELAKNDAVPKSAPKPQTVPASTSADDDVKNAETVLSQQEEEEVVSEWLSQNFTVVDLLSFWSQRQIGIQEVLVLVLHKLIRVDEITESSLLEELVSSPFWCLYSVLFATTIFRWKW